MNNGCSHCSQCNGEGQRPRSGFRPPAQRAVAIAVARLLRERKVLPDLPPAAGGGVDHVNDTDASEFEYWAVRRDAIDSELRLLLLSRAS